MKKIRADQIDVDQVIQFAGLGEADEAGNRVAGTGTIKSFHPIDTVIAIGVHGGKIHVEGVKYENVILEPNTKVLLVRE